MPSQKLYAGAKLRSVRTKLGLTQKDFAAKLGISLPYLNQMENNNRPLSTTVLLGLAQDFGADVTEFAASDTDRLVSDMREALADPIFADTTPPLNDLRLAASNAPALARAFLELHRSYRETHERLASLDEALGQQSSATASPWEEVRDFFHYTDNYVDAVDRAAERFATRATGDLAAHCAAVLSDMGVHIRHSAGEGVRHYDPATRTLTLSPRAGTRNPTVSVAAPIRASGPTRPDRGHARFRPVPDRHCPRDCPHRHGKLFRRCLPHALYPLC